MGVSIRKKCRVLLFACTVPVLAQCGLESPFTAFDPPLYVTPSLEEFYFDTNSTLNHSDTPSRLFLGFEVYYKIALNAEDIDINLTDPDDLAGAGFKRLCLSTDTFYPNELTTMPLVLIDDLDKGSDYRITIDFGIDRTPPTPVEVMISKDPAGGSATPLEIRRSVVYNYDALSDDYGYYKKFTDFGTGNDTDVDTDVLNAITTNQQVYVGIYAFAYGKSLDSQTFYVDIKSQLTYLGTSYLQLGIY